MSSGPFVIVGAGGHGRELLDTAVSLGLADAFVGFVDDSTPAGEAAERLRARGVAVVGDVAWLADRDIDHVIGVGSSAARRDVARRLDGSASTPRTLIHPSAVVGTGNRLAPGVTIGAGSTVTTNVTIGRHSHVNVGCAVQHDSVIGDFVTLSPGVLVNGDVVVEDDVFFGTGAIVTRGCRVGAGAVIGAGAVVLQDVPAGSRRFGIPARPVERG